MNLEMIREFVITLMREIHELPSDPRLFSGKNDHGWYAALRGPGVEIKVSGCLSFAGALRGIAHKVALEWMEYARNTGQDNSATAKALVLALHA